MGTATQPSDSPNPGMIFDTLLAYEKTAALRAAIELDLFRAVGEGAANAETLAARCSASLRGTRILCDYLTILGFLVKQDGVYRHSATSEAFLDPRSPHCMASISRFLGNPTMGEPFHQLAEIVRHGRTSLPGAGSVEPENPVWVEFAHSMAPMMAGMAGPLASIVLDGMPGPVKVLDIAAGHGLFGIAVARENAKAHVTALDWALVLDVAKANAAKAGVADRYSTLPGSAFDVEYGGPYDIVLLTNFLHHFDIPTCTSLLKKIHTSLKPGGKVAALEFVPNEDRVSPPMQAGFSLVMLATTESGDAYTYNDLAGMYHAAGYSQVTAAPVPNGPHTVVIGHKV